MAYVEWECKLWSKESDEMKMLSRCKRVIYYTLNRNIGSSQWCCHYSFGERRVGFVMTTLSLTATFAFAHVWSFSICFFFRLNNYSRFFFLRKRETFPHLLLAIAPALKFYNGIGLYCTPWTYPSLQFHLLMLWLPILTHPTYGFKIPKKNLVSKQINR